MFAPCKKIMTNLDSILKKQRHHSVDKGPYSQNYGFSSSHVQMWELEPKESSTPKNWCFWIVVLGKTLESPLGNNEIKPVNTKGNQPWILIERTYAEAPVLWPPDVKSRLIRKKTLMLGRLRERGEGGDREWHGWMTLSTQWTWVWTNSER